MSLVEVRLPDLGEDADEVATVSFWWVDEGDEVAEKQEVMEMYTDKAVFQVPCPVAGKVVELRVADGDKVKVGDILCILEVSR